MKRRVEVGVVVVVLLVLAACGGGDSTKDETAASKPTTTTTAMPTTTTDAPTSTTTTVAEDHVAITADCPGIGDAVSGGEITYVKDGRLLSTVDGSDPSCLVETSRPTLAWGGAGDRVLAGDHTVVLTDGPREVGDPGDRLLSWSRPTGKALLAEAADGFLTKYTLDDGEQIGIFESEVTEAAYHPAGLSIVMVVPQGDRPGLLMTSNTGENPRWIVENETANAIHDLAFTEQGALVFVAEHAGMTHVHRLDLTSEDPALDTLVTVPADEELGAVAASAWDDSRVASGPDCSGHGSLHVLLDGDDVGAVGEVADAEPVGWLPDGGLVVLTHPDGCDGPGDLYVVIDGTPTLIASAVDAAAVRAVLPPPPPPPAEIEAAPA